MQCGLMFNLRSVDDQISMCWFLYQRLIVSKMIISLMLSALYRGEIVLSTIQTYRGSGRRGTSDITCTGENRDVVCRGSTSCCTLPQFCESSLNCWQRQPTHEIKSFWVRHIFSFFLFHRKHWKCLYIHEGPSLGPPFAYAYAISGCIFSRRCPMFWSAERCKKSPFLQMHGGKWVWGSMQEIMSSSYRWRWKSGWAESVSCG